mmetsp:Transcript_66892/g.193275  ORF Transcript_66892/g.193275 Transcript_66892/m.193275 type:complete len:247 (-) Transcript_66892:144-884(-)
MIALAVPAVPLVLASVLLAGRHANSPLPTVLALLVEGTLREAHRHLTPALHHAIMLAVLAIRLAPAVVLDAGGHVPAQRVLLALFRDPALRRIYRHLAAALHDMVVLAIEAIGLPLADVLHACGHVQLQPVALALLVKGTCCVVHRHQARALHHVVVGAVEAVSLSLASVLLARGRSRPMPALLAVLIEGASLVRHRPPPGALNHHIVGTPPPVWLPLAWVPAVLLRISRQSSLRQRGANLAGDDR